MFLTKKLPGQIMLKDKVNKVMLETFQELFESNKIDFKLAIPYPDDSEYIQKILKKKD